jgi:hypothetical protein
VLSSDLSLPVGEWGRSALPAFPVSNKIPGVQPNRLEKLDDLLAQAEHYANQPMRNIGRPGQNPFRKIVREPISVKGACRQFSLIETL